jgi:hypothetical protein
MNKNCMINKKFAFFSIFILVFPNIAYAYVDPGTGAYLLQLMIALFGAVVFYSSRPIQLFKLIRDFFKRKSKE